MGSANATSVPCRPHIHSVSLNLILSLLIAVIRSTPSTHQSFRRWEVARPQLRTAHPCQDPTMVRFCSFSFHGSLACLLSGCIPLAPPPSLVLASASYQSSISVRFFSYLWRYSFTICQLIFSVFLCIRFLSERLFIPIISSLTSAT